MKPRDRGDQESKKKSFSLSLPLNLLWGTSFWKKIEKKKLPPMKQ